MKKYVKPVLMYEEFKLSEHIADCAIELQNANDESQCYALLDPEKTGLDLGEITVFVDKEHHCAQSMNYCYQNGQPNENLFRS